MERNFYSDNFENFLKGHADKFKMTPSKKVWHGIYNDLHPGTRWPSVAMSIVFIFTLVIVGHLNTNNGHTIALHNSNSLPSSNLIKSIKASTKAKQSHTKNILNQDNSATGITDNNDPVAVQLPVIKSILLSSNPPANSSNSNEKTTNVISDNSTEILSGIIENNVTKTQSLNNSDTKLSHDFTDVKVELGPETTSIINKETPSVKEVTKKTQPEANADNIRKPRRNSNVVWTYYFSPSLSYRYLSDDVNNFVVHKPRIGYEAGTEMSFKLFKNLSFTTGLQVNFSGYKIRANNAHPTIATLALNGEAPGQYSVYSSISQYSNTRASAFTRLKNYSLQASIPIGLQYVIAQNENIKISAAATFQPTFIVADRAYLLSSDKKNYLLAPELQRNWNLNTGFSTFITFSSNSYNWQIGPQVRYQLLSTYSNRYQNNEHLVNYGIRIGISKSTK
ncbi:MAG: hypothetical protein ABIQ07_04250 [Ginsengibacter sp.]